MVWKQMREPQRVAELLAAYRSKGSRPLQRKKLLMDGVQGRDVYNIAAPLDDQGVLVIPGRVEERDNETSEIHFFAEQRGGWSPLPDTPVFALQDPFHTRIGGELVLGGVQTFPHPTVEGALSWRTVFMKGTDVRNLTPFFEGPDQMKDLRLVELADGTIGIFTRPQGDKGGRGKIGFARVASLAELTVDAVHAAPLLDQFADEEWGGANEIHLLRGGKLGVLGHIACFDEVGNRHYYPMVFAVEPSTGAYTEMEMIAERSDFVPGPAKREDLVDVVFSGGLVRKADGTAELYVGTSDAEAQMAVIADPFLKFEE